MVVDTIAGAHAVRFRRRCRSYLGTYSNGDTEVILAKPVTYMNNSGRAAGAILGDYELDAKDVIFVCDDINLPLGKIRLRRKGSCGGHKGLESVAAALRSYEFPRLRIGVGGPGRMDAEEYVLAEFREPEVPVIDEARKEAAEVLNMWLVEDMDAVMNRFN